MSIEEYCESDESKEFIEHTKARLKQQLSMESEAQAQYLARSTESLRRYIQFVLFPLLLPYRILDYLVETIRNWLHWWLNGDDEINFR